MKPWIVIPARGGSTGVPRKNVRHLGGIPLIARTIMTAKSADVAGVVVVTDDDEISEISAHYGAHVVREPKTTGRATLDEVMVRTIPDLIALGATDVDVLLTMQPTCPFVQAHSIHDAMKKFESGAGSVITVVDDRHLSWKLDEDGKPTPDYVARLNRQMLPTHFRESGAIIGARIKDVVQHKTRIVQPIDLIELTPNEAIDIDTFADWAAAEHFATRRRIVIRTDATKSLGMGHVYRSLAVAYALARHDLTIVLSADKELGQEFFAEYPFATYLVKSEKEFVEYVENQETDIVILDRLDNTAHDVTALKQFAKVITFEDLGEGAEEADLLIADLYENPRVPQERQLSGVDNAILAPSFESLPREPHFNNSVENVLVLFGGTDPSHLADKALRALESISFAGTVLVVRGLGAEPLNVSDYKLTIEMLSDVKNMPALMARADIALSSAGRTITELSYMGVPTICMAQNTKELTHTHTTTNNGVLMLGLGSLVSVETLGNHLEKLIKDTDFRKTLHERALSATALRSNENVVSRMMRVLD